MMCILIVISGVVFFLGEKKNVGNNAKTDYVEKVSTKRVYRKLTLKISSECLTACQSILLNNYMKVKKG